MLLNLEYLFGEFFENNLYWQNISHYNFPRSILSLFPKEVCWTKLKLDYILHYLDVTSEYCSSITIFY